MALFGDLDLSIDLLLDGDPNVKDQVALADQADGGGYLTLGYAMRFGGKLLTVGMQAFCLTVRRVFAFGADRFLL